LFIAVRAKGIEKLRRRYLGPYELWDRNFISFPTTLVQHEMSANFRDNCRQARFLARRDFAISSITTIARSTHACVRIIVSLGIPPLSC